jgi:hypothetical protein
MAYNAGALEVVALSWDDDNARRIRVAARIFPCLCSPAGEQTTGNATLGPAPYTAGNEQKRAGWWMHGWAVGVGPIRYVPSSTSSFAIVVAVAI